MGRLKAYDWHTGARISRNPFVIPYNGPAELYDRQWAFELPGNENIAFGGKIPEGKLYLTPTDLGMESMDSFKIEMLAQVITAGNGSAVLFSIEGAPEGFGNPILTLFRSSGTSANYFLAFRTANQNKIMRMEAGAFNPYDWIKWTVHVHPRGYQAYVYYDLGDGVGNRLCLHTDYQWDGGSCAKTGDVVNELVDAAIPRIHPKYLITLGTTMDWAWDIAPTTDITDDNAPGKSHMKLGYIKVAKLALAACIPGTPCCVEPVIETALFETHFGQLGDFDTEFEDEVSDEVIYYNRRAKFKWGVTGVSTYVKLTTGMFANFNIEFSGHAKPVVITTAAATELTCDTDIEIEERRLPETQHITDLVPGNRAIGDTGWPEIDPVVRERK